MQTLTAASTAVENDPFRLIAQNLQVSWHRQSTLGNRTFTIGVSTIGGNDLIGINPGALGSPGNYKYFDESNYVTRLAWERGLKMPAGGLVKAMAEAEFDNTSGRFTPRYMGGNSELYTAILPNRPIIINAGFKVGGVDLTIPQFSGIINKQPKVDSRNKNLSVQAVDYMDYFQGRFLDNALMFTSQRTDQPIQTLLTLAGMNTAQYDLDFGINIIPFGYFPPGSRFSDVIGQLVEAEMGHFYQNESGIFKFDNRQHWSSSPYTSIQKIIATSQVLNAESPGDDHLINVVEVKSKVRSKQPNQLLFNLSTPVFMPASSNTEIFINFDDPVLELSTPTFWAAYTNSDETGVELTTSLRLKAQNVFAQSAKLVFANDSTNNAYMTRLSLYGRPAKVSTDIYYRAKDDSSVTAFQERTVTIQNDFIQSQSLAQTIAQMIINDFSVPENIQKITIRAIPELQLGDLISWQGRYWRIFDIKATLDASAGFIQELLLLQRDIISYFRIGISTIGGSDKISP